MIFETTTIPQYCLVLHAAKLPNSTHFSPNLAHPFILHYYQCFVDHWFERFHGELQTVEWYCSFCLDYVQAVRTIRRSIGSLVIGDYDDVSLSKNTLNAIQVAKDFGDVGNV